MSQRGLGRFRRRFTFAKGAGVTEVRPRGPNNGRPRDRRGPQPHVAPKAGEVAELSIKELGNFEYDQTRGGNIPADVMGMSGGQDPSSRIYDADGSSGEYHAVCPGVEPGDMLPRPGSADSTHDCLRLPQGGKTIGYCPDEIIIEGNLKVEEKKDDGYLVSIFSLGVTSVKPAPK